MDGVAACTSCCTGCATNSNRRKLPTASCPFTWQNLLPVGVIFVNTLPHSVADLCSHEHEGDGWHLFTPSAFLEYAIRVGDEILLGGMDYLVQHRFISATYRAVDASQVAVRAYFIPHDLKHVQGRLRNRKSDVLTSAKKYLKDLIPRLTKDKRNWEGLGPFNLVPFIPVEEDDLTLAEIYGSLASPAPSLDPIKNGDIMERLLDFGDDLEGLGMRSKLYQYQRRSIAMMLQKESDTRDVPDSLLLELVSMNGETFYFQPGTSEVLRERPMVASSRGGVLCEELGTGKTVMTLGLILATLRQLPEPEESILETRPVVTSLSIRHFPGLPWSTERERVSSSSSPSTVPSLVELLLHRSRTAPDTRILNPNTSQGMEEYQRRLSLMEHLEGLPLYKANQYDTPFYMQAREDPTNYIRTNRKRTTLKARVMYLSAATLVVVPANLLSQWDREIQKHCEYPLRVLLLRTGTALPDVHALANDYDIILTTYNRFTAEDTRKDISKLHTSKLCSCPEYQDYRIPNCKCKAPQGVSPFLRIRWKRLVIDEGHISASLTNVLVPFTKLLSVERRWIVTGTPTTNLLGLGLGRKGEELGDADTNENEAVEMEEQDSSHQIGDNTEDFEMGEPTPTGISSESLDNSPTPDLTPFLSSTSPSSSTSLESLKSQSLQLSSSSARRPRRRKRIWTRYDREDLTKLGNMITHFVAVPRFAGDPKVINTHVIEPLLDPSGPRPGAINVSRQVMEAVMIRHRIEDVERDVLLPPIKHESVMLDLDPYAVKSYNALQATIAINAVDSERTDQDYMFHPKNVDALQLTVKNMSQIMFWSVDHDLHNADQLLRDADIHINTALERKATQEDIQILQDAFRHIRSAAQDKNWRGMQTHEDVPYRVYDMHHGAYDTWTRISREEHEDHNPIPHRHPKDSTTPQKPTYSGLMHPDRLLKLRDLIISHPLASIESIIKLGVDVAEKDRRHKQSYEEEELRKQRKKKGGATSSRSQKGTTDTMEAEPNSEAASITKKRIRNNRPAMHVHDELYDNAKVASAAKKASATQTMKEIQIELDDSLRKIQAEEAGYLDEEGELKGNDQSEANKNAGYQRPDFSQNRSIGTVSKLVAKSPLASARIGSSASSKLNYIINDVLKYSPTEKLLIFSESELSLAHVAEALDLIQVKFLRFTTQIKPQFREQLVLTFETSETFRVFLMELKHGARGLNLVSASRVIFCEPVWHADIESQAIKRAHRIGQTKPIVVKTLAIRGTAEEAMVARRNALKDQVDKLPKLIEEAGMRHFIANPKFVEDAPTLLTTLDVPLFKLQTEPEYDTTNIVGTSNIIDISSTSLPETSSPPSPRINVKLPNRASVQMEYSNSEGHLIGKVGQSSELQIASESSESGPKPPKKRRVVRFEDD